MYGLGVGRRLSQHEWHTQVAPVLLAHGQMPVLVGQELLALVCEGQQGVQQRSLIYC